jgi:hypothetical protein
MNSEIKIEVKALAEMNRHIEALLELCYVELPVCVTKAVVVRDLLVTGNGSPEKTEIDQSIVPKILKLEKG